MELKKCPFCGAVATSPRKISSKGRPVWEVSCNWFCVTMRRGSKKQAIADWNKRNKTINEHKKHLIELTKTVIHFLDQINDEMKKPSSFERGRRIAKLCNFLDLENDGAMHFGLNYTFKKIKKLKGV